MSATPESRFDALSIPITCTILGLCLDDSLCAVLRVGRSLQHELNLPSRHRKLFLTLTLLTFNTALSLNSIFLIWAFFTSPEDCFPVNMGQGLTFHIFGKIFHVHSCDVPLPRVPHGMGRCGHCADVPSRLLGSGSATVSIQAGPARGAQLYYR
ncbi:hypothetical protein BC830DRAFT_666236 [Chytriomyces sp. MP71]|nr:hypothetical protein BC830DRAFT_666236 [Chytriomyces sp. MP71]